MWLSVHTLRLLVEPKITKLFFTMCSKSYNKISYCVLCVKKHNNNNYRTLINYELQSFNAIFFDFTVQSAFRNLQLVGS